MVLELQMPGSSGLELQEGTGR